MASASDTTSRALQKGLDQAARALNVALTHDQSERLLAYVSLLQRWNAIHNLSGANDPATLLNRHVIDCLAIVAPMTAKVGLGMARALDAGSGAGLPAVVLATAFPTWTVTAVDAVAKKVAFLRQVAGELALPNLQPMHARLEDCSLEQRCNVITSRAFGSLREFVQRTHHLLQPDGLWAAMKGLRPLNEIENLPANCQLFHVEPLPGVAGERCLVWMTPNPTAS